MSDDRQKVTLSDAKTEIVGENGKPWDTSGAPVVSLGMREMIKDFLSPVVGVLTWDFGKPGDQQYRQAFRKELDDFLGGGRYAENKFDVRMAIGWQPEGKIKVNGVETVLDKPIDNMLAVFVRSPNGEVEILDPSLKIHGIGEFLKKYPVLPLLLDDKSEADRRWADTAGIYIETQVLPMVLGGVGGLAAKAITNSGKTGAAIEAVKKGAQVAGAVGGIQGTLAISEMGSAYYMSRVSDSVADDLAQKISRLLSDPKSLTTDDLREAMNDGLHEYSFNHDTNNHMYVPSLRDHQDPWERFSEVLQGSIDGYQKANNPWEEWQRSETLIIEGVSDKIENNNLFMTKYYQLAEKALEGKSVSDAENLVLRVGLAVQSKWGYDIAGEEFSDGKIKYTPEEHAKTLDSVRGYLTRQMVAELDQHPDLMRRLGVDADGMANDKYDYVKELRSQFRDNPVDSEVLQTYAHIKAEQCEAAHEMEIKAAQQRVYPALILAP